MNVLGVKFSDLELTGIPHRIVIGEKGLDAGTFEYKGRRDAESEQPNERRITHQNCQIRLNTEYKKSRTSCGIFFIWD